MKGTARGLWLPVDPTFNEFPANATHVRLARGGLHKQAAILPMIGRLKMTVVDLELLRTDATPPILVGRQQAGLFRRLRQISGHWQRAGNVRVQPMITVQELVKQYGRFIAVDHVNLDVAPGEIPRISGTEWRRQDDHAAHDRRAAETDLGPHSSTATIWRRSRRPPEGSLGFIPDRPFIYEKLTAGEFLRFHGGLYGIDGAEVGRVHEMLDLFELRRWEHELMESFSHGMKQRLVMSAAFLHRPRAVAVDEPMVGLDPRGARLIKDVFRRMSERGVAILMSTHTLEVAEEMCHRVSIIQKGRIIAHGRWTRSARRPGRRTRT